MTRTEYRLKLSEILVKWSMPTRQAAILEILQLRDKDFDELIGEDVRAHSWKETLENEIRGNLRKKAKK